MRPVLQFFISPPVGPRVVLLLMSCWDSNLFTELFWVQGTGVPRRSLTRDLAKHRLWRRLGTFLWTRVMAIRIPKIFTHTGVWKHQEKIGKKKPTRKPMFIQLRLFSASLGSNKVPKVSITLPGSSNEFLNPRLCHWSKDLQSGGRTGSRGATKMMTRW